MSDYDSFILNGAWHVCDCGKRYCEADGPCHVSCKGCGSLIKIDDFVAKEDSELCFDCQEEILNTKELY